jgi:GntR family transcriptional regulator of arabinose operon
MRALVASGAYAPGMLLPARRVLAKEFDVSLATIELAIKSLVASGVLRAENGRGTFVCDNAGTVRYAATSTDGYSAQASQKPPQRLVVGIISFLDPEYHITHPRQRPHTSVVIEGFERAITECGGVTHFGNTHGHPQTPEYIREAICRQVDELGVQGVLIAAPRFQVDVFQAARISPIPTVVAENQFSPAAVHQVYYDCREEGYRAASQLLRSGHDRILYFAPYTAQWVGARWAGIEDAVAGHETRITACIDDTELAERLLEVQRETAVEFAKTVSVDDIAGAGIVACNDAAAIALIERAASEGLVAGQDYSIVGFDDLYLARDFGLATFRPPFSRMGEQAAEMISKLITGQDPPMRQCLNSEFVMRRSIRHFQKNETTTNTRPTATLAGIR